ncbi:MAG: flagellin lysine-N-methylase [Rickettsiales bacterium]|nr:flagellin lysine-N-methylase [Rickettsiales bacterium]
MMLQSTWLEGFECLGDKCEDTCCKGWGMQVDKATIARYEAEAPELMEFVTSGEVEHIMKRDAETDHCVKFDNGWCGIHAAKGTEFLGDACHFFPRVTRQLGETVVQTATISCPEVARRALLAPTDTKWVKPETDRTPLSLANYLPDGLENDKALEIHEAFLQAAIADGTPAGEVIAQFHAVAQSMQMIDIATWPMAVGFYLKSADSRLGTPEAKTEDPFHLYHSLAGLVGAARKSNRPRLEAVLGTMHKALDIQIDAATSTIAFGINSMSNLQTMREGWKFVDDQWQPYFKRWVRAQLGMALFPFSGFGETLTDRITIIGVRLATLRLALQCHLFVHQTLSEEEAITITQSLARFLDHLADPALTMQIYTETGWTKTTRLQGLFL